MPIYYMVDRKGRGLVSYGQDQPARAPHSTSPVQNIILLVHNVPDLLYDYPLPCKIADVISLNSCPPFTPRFAIARFEGRHESRPGYGRDALRAAQKLFLHVLCSVEVVQDGAPLVLEQARIAALDRAVIVDEHGGVPGARLALRDPEHHRLLGIDGDEHLRTRRPLDQLVAKLPTRCQEIGRHAARVVKGQVFGEPAGLLQRICYPRGYAVHVFNAPLAGFKGGQLEALAVAGPRLRPDIVRCGAGEEAEEVAYAVELLRRKADDAGEISRSLQLVAAVQVDGVVRGVAVHDLVGC